MSDPEILPTLQGADVIKNDLVSKAKEEINKILTNHLGAAAYEVAKYLLINFFGNDVVSFKKRKTLASHKSFQQLLSEIGGETGKSKSWIYDAINLYLDMKELGNSNAYKAISISHRTLLLRVDIDKKRELAEIFFNKKMTYEEAKGLVAPASRDTDYSKLSYLIQHVDDIEEDEFIKATEKTTLKTWFEKLKDEQRDMIRAKAINRIKKLEADLAEQKKRLERTKAISAKLDKISRGV